jgi:p-hydroxybenzoate 3-monooxygenase
MRQLRTQVAVVGAGPAGLFLANALGQGGVDCVVVERESREQVEQRARAGLLEHRAVELLRAHGLAERLVAEGTRHGWCDFRCAGRTVRVDYAAASGGYRHWVYPQQFLVRDLIAALESAGRTPLFGERALGIEGLSSDRPRVVCDGMEIECDYVVGCDGSQGVARAALAPMPWPFVNCQYPYSWLAVLAEVDRPAEGVRYTMNSAGFAAMMPRTRQISRFYLQCPPRDSPQDWPEDRVRQTLESRLGDGPDVDRDRVPTLGRVLERNMLTMRSSVARSFGHSRLLLAGDAAHLLTPAGAKGMNLAIADAAYLGRALVAACRHGDRHELDGYTDQRLPDAGRAQGFSDWLLRLLHLSQEEVPDAARALSARLATVEGLARPGAQAAAFAHRYVGSPDQPAADAG